MPNRAPLMRTVATESDANPGGDIFGGWLLGQMDLAGGIHAYTYTQEHVVTVGVEAMSFHKPVFVGDEVQFFTEIARHGTTSIAIRIEAWATRKNGEQVKVTEGVYTFVALDRNRQPVEYKKVA
ncbi:MAG: acyl-CoA thioesterase [Alphaproteobacteria bacterium]|nr:acyl-CoA thioesterase [Alphaproteobacteria bacterium]